MATGPRNDEMSDKLKAQFLEARAWQDLTGLTIAQSGNVTYTTTYAKAVVLAQTVIFMAEFAITGTGTAGNAIEIGDIPAALAVADATTYALIGNALVIDAGTDQYHGGLVARTSTAWRIITNQNGNWLGITPSFALASGDIISLHAVYERG